MRTIITFFYPAIGMALILAVWMAMGTLDSLDQFL